MEQQARRQAIDYQFEIWRGIPHRSPKSVYLMYREGNVLTAVARLSVSPKRFIEMIGKANGKLIPFVIDFQPFQDNLEEAAKQQQEEAAQKRRALEESADF